MFRSLGRNNLLVMLALLILALGEGLWYNLRQLYLSGLGAGPLDVGTALAMESIGKAIVLLPAGYGIDRLGARQMMLASWATSIAGLIVIASATAWPVAAVGMMIYGASAFAIPSVSAYALLAVRASDHPRGAQGILTPIFAAYPLGLIISPTLGGLLAQSAGTIRACLFLSLGLYAVSMGVVLATHPFDPHPADSEYRVDALLHNRGYLWRAAYFAAGMFALWVGFALMPNFLHDVRGVDLAAIGLLFSVLSVGTTVANLGAGRLTQRWGYPAVLILVWLGTIGVWQVSTFAGIAPAFFALGAIFTARTLAVAGLERTVRPQDRGMAFSGLEMLTALTTAAAAQAAGALYKASSGHDLPLLAGIVGLPVVALIWFAGRMWHTHESEVGVAQSVAISQD